MAVSHGSPLITRPVFRPHPCCVQPDRTYDTNLDKNPVKALSYADIKR